MIATIQSLLPYLVLGFHVFLIISILALIFRNSWGREMVDWAGKHALILGLITAIIAVTGSLFYSNGVGFAPCYLCWWQRIGIYPLLVMFVVAFKKKDKGVFSYVLPLSVLTAVIAVYHSYVQWGGNPLIPCDATASCDKLYVYAFNYITIPTMSLTIALAMILISIANRIHENRHA